MIHSSHRERKIKAVAEVLAMISDTHPELVRHRPPVRETDEWMRESPTEFCAGLDRYAERATGIKRQDRRAPGRAYVPARPRRHARAASAEREKVVNKNRLSNAAAPPCHAILRRVFGLVSSCCARTVNESTCIGLDKTSG
jgi:hypothetical protein